MKRSLASLVVVVVVFVAGCSPWVEAEQLDRIVWADDDSELALLELLFEERQGDPLDGTTAKQNFRHQLQRSTLDGESQVPIGEQREGQSGADLYFMKSAGYLVSSAFDDDGRLRYWRVELADGVARAIPDDDDADESFALPSPDAAHIAVISVAPPAVRVQLLHQATLDELFEAPREVTSLEGAPDWTWRSDGALVVTDGSEAYALTAEAGDFSPTGVPACTTPKTTSSEISSEGVVVQLSATGLIELDPQDPALAFGCQ